jgi:hypothetical protein
MQSKGISLQKNCSDKDKINAKILFTILLSITSGCLKRVI